MIYELTTIDLKPRTLAPVEEAFAKLYAAMGIPPELMGFFHSEFGPLNQIVQIWKYADLAERTRVTRRLEEGGRWPALLAESLLSLRTEILKPVWFSRELTLGQFGPYFELRTYSYPPGTLQTIMKAWERAMPMRDALGSPVAVILETEIGVLNTLTHLWPYASLDERDTIRKEMSKKLWPPFKLDEAEGGPGYEILRQENKLMMPAAFSPMQ